MALPPRWQPPKQKVDKEKEEELTPALIQRRWAEKNFVSAPIAPVAPVPSVEPVSLLKPHMLSGVMRKYADGHLPSPSGIELVRTALEGSLQGIYFDVTTAAALGQLIACIPGVHATGCLFRSLGSRHWYIDGAEKALIALQLFSARPTT